MSDGKQVTKARSARRVPMMLLGIMVVAGGALGVALWSQQQSQRTPVLVTARALTPGDTVTFDDLRSTPIAVGDGVSVMPDTALESLVGQTVLTSVGEGSVVSVSMFGAADSIVPAGSVLVGAVLEPGRFPPSGLRPGDEVELISTSSNDAAVVIGTAEVFWVETLTTGSAAGDVAVSLVIGSGATVTATTAAAADGELSLVVN